MLNEFIGLYAVSDLHVYAIRIDLGLFLHIKHVYNVWTVSGAALVAFVNVCEGEVVGWAPVPLVLIVGALVVDELVVEVLPSKESAEYQRLEREFEA